MLVDYRSKMLSKKSQRKLNGFSASNLVMPTKFQMAGEGGQVTIQLSSLKVMKAFLSHFSFNVLHMDAKRAFLEQILCHLLLLFPHLLLCHHS